MASIGYHLSVSRLEVYLVETNGSTTKDFIQKRNLVEKPVTAATGSETVAYAKGASLVDTGSIA